MNEKNLDERQVTNRNKIGNQSFLLLAYLLFADAGLYGFGVKWLPYPANIIVILMACLFVYLLRLIASSSYAGPGTGNKRIYAVIAVIGIAVSIAAAFIILLNGGGEPKSTTEGNSGMTLFIISAVMLVVVLGISIIKKRQDKEGKDE